MKLASYHDGSRDGHLVVVSRDLSTAHYASGIATRLQQVLDDWNFLSPQLEDLSTTLNHGRARHAFTFDAARCAAPLPRAYQRVVAASGAAGAADGTPLLQRSGTALLAAHGDAVRAGDVGLAVVCGDVPADATPDSALEGVRLLLLTLDLGDGAAAFAPLAVTLDELGAAWRGGRAHLAIDCRHGARTERADGAAMPQHFGELIAALANGQQGNGQQGNGQQGNGQQGGRPGAAGRGVAAGSIVGSAALLSLPAGERWRVEATGADGHSVFGTIG